MLPHQNLTYLAGPPCCSEVEPKAVVAVLDTCTRASGSHRPTTDHPRSEYLPRTNWTRPSIEGTPGCSAHSSILASNGSESFLAICGVCRNRLGHRFTLSACAESESGQRLPFMLSRNLSSTYMYSGSNKRVRFAMTCIYGRLLIRAPPCHTVLIISRGDEACVISGF